jgi:acetyl esterase/lipase
MQLVPQLEELVLQFREISSLATNLNKPLLISDARDALAMLTKFYVTDIPNLIQTYDGFINRQNYAIPVRIYYPQVDQQLKVAVFIHGGGHNAGSIEVYDPILRKLAKTTNCIWLSIDYRLAPEFPYPTGLEDCRSVINQRSILLDQLGINYSTDQLIIAGDSAGGALCASLTLDYEFIATNQITQQILIYPSLDYSLSLPSTHSLGKGYLLERDKIEWYFNNYFQNNEDRRLLSPLYQELPANYPATLIIGAEYDPLIDEAVAYNEKLHVMNISSEFHKISGVVHTYLMLEDLCLAECKHTYNLIKNFIK